MPDAKALSTQELYDDILKAVENDQPIAAEVLLAELRQRLPRGEAVDIRLTATLAVADLQLRRGDFAESELWLLRALHDGPYLETLYRLGNLKLLTNSQEEALRWFEAACAVSPMPWKGSGSETADRFKILEQLRTPLPRVKSDPPPRYFVIVPVRNAEKWIANCISSIQEQKTKTRVYTVVIDDCSTDETLHVAGTARKNASTVVMKNLKRQYALRNIYEMSRFAEEEDVIVVIDGDDRLLHDEVFATLDNCYSTGAWMTYGSFVTARGQPSFIPAYPHKVIRDGSFRQHAFCGSHLKTFKRWLFDKIDVRDFLDDKGEWFKTTYDVAMMTPMFEMARERAYYIHEPLYVYNDTNPASDHNEAWKEQVETRNLINSRKPYERITDALRGTR